ncbi:Uncharacterised protein [Mycobacteroides abscessus]|nr:Uncharacterised protein [Mycobacteroides abscessus]
MSRISRHGGAHSPCSAISRLRWSATANQRISDTSSPQNSTRSGWSSVGGKMSRMPPRTANSPRRSTMSTRVYAAATSRSATSVRSAVVPACSSTGSRSPSPSTTGCRSARTGMTSTRTGPDGPTSGSGCARRRNTAMRLATVSARGLRRSCGSVSQLGSTATTSPSSSGR